MYDTDQEYKEKQQEYEVAHHQERWEDGFDDAQAGTWRCCTEKLPKCDLYCRYLAGYHKGQEELLKQQYYAECSSNLAVLDSEYYDEF